MPKRDLSHVNEEKSKIALESFLLPWILHPEYPDYGRDFLVTITDTVSNITPNDFYIQLKSIQHIQFNKNVATYSYDTDHIQYFLKSFLPIYLVLYDISQNRLYWINILEYSPLDKMYQQKTVSIHFSPKNIFLTRTELEFDVKQTQTNIIAKKYHKLSWEDTCKYIKNDIGSLKQLIDKEKSDLDRKKLKLSDLSTIQGDFTQSQQTLKEIINENKRDISQLISLFQLLILIVPSDNQKIIEYSSYMKQALSLAQELKEERFMILLKCLDSLKLNQITIYKLLDAIYVFKNPKILNIFRPDIKGEVLKCLGDINRNFQEIQSYQKVLYEKGMFSDYIWSWNYSFSNMIQFGIYVRINSTKTQFKLYLNDLKPIAETLFNISQFLEHDMTLLSILESLARYFINFNPRKANEIFLSSIQIAKQLNSDSLVKRLQHAQLYCEINKVLSFKEYFLPESKEYYRQLFVWLGLSIISDKDLLLAFENGFKNFDATSILKTCEHLKIKYFPSDIGKAYNIHSIGTQFLFCKYGKAFWMPNGLQDFHIFQKTYCSKCNHQNPREKEWGIKLKELLKISFTEEEKNEIKKCQDDMVENFPKNNDGVLFLMPQDWDDDVALL